MREKTVIRLRRPFRKPITNVLIFEKGITLQVGQLYTEGEEGSSTQGRDYEIVSCSTFHESRSDLMTHTYDAKETMGSLFRNRKGKLPSPPE